MFFEFPGDFNHAFHSVPAIGSDNIGSSFLKRRYSVLY